MEKNIGRIEKSDQSTDTWKQDINERIVKSTKRNCNIGLYYRRSEIDNSTESKGFQGF